LHIPDGYLSPSTCGIFVGAAAPFWYTALRRVQKTLTTRMVPLLSVFAAFSFVIMMFNLPLPGGTTGHAVGMGVASIVLGPWASMLAISIALVIQAVFFGDGGITAIGANCFNMAIVGSLASYAFYRLIGFRATLGSARRILAAGIGGYLAINIAAFCAAIEFGIQPLLFRDASGAPLYAPYPLSVSIPAMMIGHLTLAGLAEFIISAGIIAYLQRTDLGLLRLSAPDAPDYDAAVPEAPEVITLPTARNLWLGLALLLILTPFGILAVGSAWGEWTAQELSNPQVREQIAAVSGNQLPPDRVPRGLERLSAIWTAPLSRYAPGFIRSPAFGYFVSGMVGVGLILASCVLATGLLTKGRSKLQPGPVWAPFNRPRRKSFVEKTIRSLLDAMQHTLFAEDMAVADGLLQRFDPRVKLIGIAALILAVIAVRRIWVLAGIFLAAIFLAILSHVPVRTLATRVWVAVLGFTGVIALPAIFLTPGEPVFQVPVLGWSVTSQGVKAAAFLILRAETAATLSILLILTTLWTHLLAALRSVRLPSVLVAILGMTYRYMFLFLQIARDMFESRESRLVGILAPSDRRRLAVSSAGVLLGKSLQLSGEVHMAMQSRGFRGQIRLLHESEMGWGNWLRAAGFVAFGVLAIWLGR
jgi:cobalt/nickel transport system permease protein